MRAGKAQRRRNCFCTEQALAKTLGGASRENLSHLPTRPSGGEPQQLGHLSTTFLHTALVGRGRVRDAAARGASLERRADRLCRPVETFGRTDRATHREPPRRG